MSQYPQEHEIIVKPHRWNAAASGKIKKDLWAKYVDTEEYINPDINQRINQRQYGSKYEKANQRNKELSPFKQVKKLAASELKESDLMKAPIIDEGASAVSIWQDSFGGLDKRYKHVKSIKSKNGNIIHHFHDVDSEGNPEKSVFAITHDNTKSGKSISQVEVSHHGEGDEPQLRLAYTEKAHRGKGLNYDLHRYAVKHFGTLESDTTLSPASHKLWEKMSNDPSMKVDIAPIDHGDPYENQDLDEDAFSSHTATWKKPAKKKTEKLAASEALEQDLNKNEDVKQFVRRGILAAGLIGMGSTTGMLGDNPNLPQRRLASDSEQSRVAESIAKDPTMRMRDGTPLAENEDKRSDF